MEENRQKNLSWKNVVPELGTMVIFGLLICGYSIWKQISIEIALRNLVMSLLGVAIVGFLHRQELVTGGLDYNNSEHPFRFWVAVWCGIAVACVCVFLPTGGWPVLPVFVLLSLFSNMSIGVAAASVLLMFAVLLTEASAGVFFLYFISGVFAATLFRQLKNDFAVGVPLFLAMLCLVVCETANIVLTANERLSFEQFLVPAANIVICSVFLLGILKMFSTKVVYQYRELYLEWNDMENPILSEYKKNERDAYFICVHTAYFCERIAKKLSLNVDALKCAGYYYKMDMERLQEEQGFPPEAMEILREYHTTKKAVAHKETAVLLCSESIVNSILYVISKGQEMEINYEPVIDAVFQKFHEKGTFKKCNITMQELNTMHRIFKEEKLYYDFLR